MVHVSRWEQQINDSDSALLVDVDNKPIQWINGMTFKNTS